MTEDDIKNATEYLRANRELWEALGIEDGSSLTAAPLAQGEHNANYWFAHPATGERYVLRFNYISQLELVDQVGYEYAVLEELAPSRCTPKPLYADNSRRYAPRGVLVMEYVGGQMLDFEDSAQLSCAAKMLADVHAVVPHQSGALLRPGDALADLIAECERMYALYEASPLADPVVKGYIQRFFDKAREQLAIKPDPAEYNHIISTEMVSAHFLIDDDARSGHIVDWEKAIVGEATRDVAYFLAPTTTIWDTDFIFTPDARDAFVEEYWDAVAGRFERGCFDARFDAYTMGNCLRGMTWSAMAWVQYHDPAHPLKNAKTFEKLKVYLSKEFMELLARDYYHL